MHMAMLLTFMIESILFNRTWFSLSVSIFLTLSFFVIRAILLAALL